MTDNPTVNRARRRALLELERLVTRRDFVVYGQPELKEVNIRATCVDFDLKEPGFEQRFFNPYRTELLTPPPDDPDEHFPKRHEPNAECPDLVFLGNARILLNFVQGHIFITAVGALGPRTVSASAQDGAGRSESCLFNDNTP